MSKEQRNIGGLSLNIPIIDGIPIVCDHLWKDTDIGQRCAICGTERI